MLFDSVRERSQLDAPFERRAMSGMLDLAPQGLDEVFALLSIVDALAPSRGRPSHDTLVVDMPPTGHALRLLALPGLAREWVRVLLALLLKYRSATGLGELARDLTALSADLGRLDALLRDGQATRAVVVSRPAELPRRESERLIRGLRALGVTVSALLVDAVNEAPAGSCPRCREIAASDAREIARLRARARTRGKPYPTVLAPAVTPPPRGVAGLKGWSRTWVQATG
jgi:anion-transporting  ArsA/GET3 family ATPase